MISRRGCPLSTQLATLCGSRLPAGGRLPPSRRFEPPRRQRARVRHTTQGRSRTVAFESEWIGTISLMNSLHDPSGRPKDLDGRSVPSPARQTPLSPIDRRSAKAGFSRGATARPASSCEHLRGDHRQEPPVPQTPPTTGRELSRSRSSWLSSNVDPRMI